MSQNCGVGHQAGDAGLAGLQIHVSFLMWAYTIRRGVRTQWGADLSEGSSHDRDDSDDSDQRQARLATCGKHHDGHGTRPPLARCQWTRRAQEDFQAIRVRAATRRRAPPALTRQAPPDQLATSANLLEFWLELLQAKIITKNWLDVYNYFYTCSMI
jgi:hypothetical protein